ncbi:MAG: VanZ family protein [Muribaculaceae bacterium]
MKRNWYKYLFIIITFFVIGFIWWNSSKNGEESSGISQGVLYEIMQIFARIGISTDITEHIIRKLAHFTEFTALGILLSIDTVLFLKNMKQYVWIPLFIGFLVALIDETIQLFPVGRSSSVKDVWLDFSGVIFGTILLLVLKQIYLFKLRKTLK